MGPDVHTQTTTRLLDELRDPANDRAWVGFDARYRPVLAAFGRRLGFSSSDAEELAQATLAEFAKAYRDGRYERGQGRLSSWLIGIARNVGSGMRRAQGRGGPMGGDTQLGAVAGDLGDEKHLSQVWAREREQAILADALQALRSSARLEPHTLKAFELFTLRGVPAEEVAAECGIDVDTVYVIKNRLTKRLREIVREMTTAYEEGE